jgi:hypothetical protein
MYIEDQNRQLHRFTQKCTHRGQENNGDFDYRYNITFSVPVQISRTLKFPFRYQIFIIAVWVQNSVERYKLAFLILAGI